MYLCVVNSIGLVCGDCGLGCALKGVEGKVKLDQGFLVVWDLYPRAAVCLPEGEAREYKSHTP